MLDWIELGLDANTIPQLANRFHHLVADQLELLEIRTVNRFAACVFHFSPNRIVVGSGNPNTAHS
jgi:hypothetical protein